MSTVSTVLNWLGAGGGLVGSGAFVQALVSRTKVKAEATQLITDAAVAEIKELQVAAASARQEAREARTEAQEARAEALGIRHELEQVRTAAERLVTRLQEVTDAIHRPDMTLERLRVICPASTPTNGERQIGRC